jgi:hypothetical protein
MFTKSAPFMKKSMAMLPSVSAADVGLSIAFRASDGSGS